MSRKELERGLRRFARKERLFRSFIPVGILGGLIALFSLAFSLPAEVSTLLVVWLVWLLLPTSSTAVARLINRQFGDDPDFLCAVEQGRGTAAPVEALRIRAITELQRYESTLTLGRKWFALVAVCGWALPLWGGLENDVTIMRSEMPNVQNTTAVEIARSSVEAHKNDRRLTESSDPDPSSDSRSRSRETSGSKGQEAMNTGTKRRLMMGKSQTVDNTTSNSEILERQPSDLKLTGKRLKGTVKLLKQDRLDPSEKYPVEYHEAIREWFLRRRE
ncbi:MAG: hypothetical protein ACPGQS_04865 [Bradymonadia bacterium]